MTHDVSNIDIFSLARHVDAVTDGTQANGGKKLASICRTNLIQICSDGFARGCNQLALCDLLQMLKYDNLIKDTTTDGSSTVTSQVPQITVTTPKTHSKVWIGLDGTGIDHT